MEIRIGVQHAGRELTVETDESAEAVEQRIADAVSSGGILTLSDSKGRRVVIPADRLAFVEIGGGVSGQVGFRS